MQTNFMEIKSTPTYEDVAKYRKELYSTIHNNIHNKETPLEYTENIINGAVSSELCEAVFLEIRGDEAVQMLEILQKWLDANLHVNDFRRYAVVLMVKLAHAADITTIPSLSVVGPMEYHSDIPEIGPGGRTDIYDATYAGQVVSVTYARGDFLLKAVIKEAILRRQFNHANISPFIGIDYTELHRSGPGLTSPRASRGTIKCFIISPDYYAFRDRNTLLRGVASGINYLHHLGIIHGDIADDTVLVDQFRQPYLTGFDLLSFNGHLQRGLDHPPDTYGAANWMAPERMDPKLDDNHRTEQSDIYAYGCLCYAVCTGNAPFSNYTPPAVRITILGGKRPDRPISDECIGDDPPSNSLWRIIARCWTQEASERPSIKEIIDTWGTLNLLASPHPLVVSYASEVWEKPCNFRVTARYAFDSTHLPLNGSNPPYLSFVKGEELEVFESRQDWMLARNARGGVGLVPHSYFVVGLFEATVAETIYTTNIPDQIFLAGGIRVSVLKVGKDRCVIKSTNGRTASVPSNYITIQTHSSKYFTHTARAIDNYTPAFEVPNRLPLVKGEIVKVTPAIGQWLPAMKEKAGRQYHGLVPAFMVKNIP